jgi:ribosome-associated translation inhibitor RaiA
MPRCEGRPDGPCPTKKNDKSVHLSQGDLMLCSACENFRFPPSTTDANAYDTGANTKTSRTERQPGVAGRDETPLGGGSGTAVHAASTSTTSESATANASTNLSGRPAEAKIVIDELLTYAAHFRDRCTSADLHKSIIHFYLPVEISTSKALILKEFSIYLTDSSFITPRRQTTTRPAHAAEIDDILGMLESLDNLNVLSSIQFVAASLDRLPRYGPNEINVCTVVDKQLHVEQQLTELTLNVQNETSKCYNQVAQLAAANDKANAALQTRVTMMADRLSEQMQQLETICKNVHSRSSESVNASPKKVAAEPQSDDRAFNIVVFGVAEDKNRAVWSSTIQDTLHHVAGRSVDITDAFRIGKFNAQRSRPRPIVVKLRSVWDRRLVLSNARKLAEKPDFRHIGFAPDEPIEIRRKNIMKRLLSKATNEGKPTSIIDNGNELYINDELVFTLRDGFIRKTDSVINSS